MNYTKTPLPKIVAELLVKEKRAGSMYQKNGLWYVTTGKKKKEMKQFIYYKEYRNCV
jgi:hypothetical protein